MSPREPESPTLRLTDDTAHKLRAMSSTRLIADEKSRRDSRSSPKRSVEEEEKQQQRDGGGGKRRMKRKKLLRASARCDHVPRSSSQSYKDIFCKVQIALPQSIFATYHSCLC
jgi:hypothetical protein